MDDKFSIEALSIGVAHAVYRNTAIEDFHADCRIMDEAFYNDVYKVVSEKVNALIKNIPLLICAHQNGILSIPDLKHVPAEDREFLQNVVYGILCGSSWDAPQKTELCHGNDIAGFLLEGEFKKYCNGKQIFDNSVMKPINKDIVNRVYCILKHYMDKS